MTTNASTYRYREDNKGWGNNPRNASQRDSLHLSLMRTVPEAPKPIAWDDVSNFKGKNVWGVFEGKRQLLYVVSLAPEGKEGERWYVMPKHGKGCNYFSVGKHLLELPNPYALVVLPSTKTRITGRALPTPPVIYLGA